MIGIVIALALAGPADAASLAPGPPFVLPPPSEARHEVAACGLAEATVAVQPEPGSGEEVLWIADDSSHQTEEMLHCIARASFKTAYGVYFRNAADQLRYNRIFSDVADEAGTKRAREWLRDRNMLATLPIFRKGMPLSRYTEAVEEFCGVKKGALLAVSHQHLITTTPDGFGHVTAQGLEGGAANEAQFECVLNAISAADLTSRGIFFGFIGNAKIDDQ